MNFFRSSATLLLSLIFSQFINAQTQSDSLRVYLYNSENSLGIFLDLVEESQVIPGYEFLGMVHGYMRGKLANVWILNKYERKGVSYELRFSDDNGADSQTILLTPIDENTYSYEVKGSNNVKCVDKRRYVKLPSNMLFKVTKKW